MAYGGGTWQTQNKVLPGTYINFTSIAKASASLSDRGVAAAPFALNWGPEETVFTVTAGDFQKNSKEIFGYAYDAPKMLYLREIFCGGATQVFCYRLGKGAVQATNAYGKARYPGIRGNDINIVITANVDDESAWDVSTYVGGSFYEKQTVTNASGLVDNAFVLFAKDAELAETAGTPMTGGANVEEITGEAHQAFLDHIESYSYNVLCCPAADATTVKLYEAFTKRMRDDVGAKFQLVSWQSAADYEGVIGAWNTATHSTIDGVATNALVYWIAGAQAGIAVNASLTNTKYNGELTINAEYTQEELKAAIKAGKFIFHNANGEIRVLDDINTLVTLTDTKGAVFQSNQTIRVCDQIANDVAVLFNTRYVGIVPNDASGRATLWNDVVKLMQELERIRAIENFDPATVTMGVGDSKKAVTLTITGLNIINAMAQLYMSVIIQ